ncbi:hypothetical protein [Alteriqipengyuania lutimaris]|uniref:hypothetical protein n=1 Tax=Alteriqipengyuania lutimaris TaxID=1538146 RepID=UPI0011C0775D|nr:hypothetical protein [Alteriqipengyuania lutimaris]MBB3034683.1 hypothetical protein [Alteriqipengyuania lutimaris]
MRPVAPHSSVHEQTVGEFDIVAARSERNRNVGQSVSGPHPFEPRPSLALAVFLDFLFRAVARVGKIEHQQRVFVRDRDGKRQATGGRLECAQQRNRVAFLILRFAAAVLRSDALIFLFGDFRLLGIEDRGKITGRRPFVQDLVLGTRSDQIGLEARQKVRACLSRSAHT